MREKTWRGLIEKQWECLMKGKNHADLIVTRQILARVWQTRVTKVLQTLYICFIMYVFNVLCELIEILPEGCVLKAKMLHCCPVELLKNKGHINLRIYCRRLFQRSLLVLELAFKLPLTCLDLWEHNANSQYSKTKLCRLLVACCLSLLLCLLRLLSDPKPQNRLRTHK